ncbi:MAG TPA: DUF2232 domain-containing protein [Deltaproteobacteria bacterium]|nr:DUF2232 domain-containing protein [Deltaproteobacteria bacterium]
MCVLAIMAPVDALPVMLCLPALYSSLSERLARPAYAAAAALAPALLAFVPGLAGSALVYLFFIGCGMVLSRLLGKGHISLAVLVPASLMFALLFSGALFLSAEKGVSMTTLVAGWVDGFMDQMMAVYSQTSSQAVVENMKEFRSTIEGHAVRLFWGLTASTVLSIMWVNLLIANRVSRRYRLREWRCPDWVVGLFILASVLSLLQYGPANLFGLNLLIVVIQVYFFQGIAIVASVMIQYDWSRFIRYVIYILILTQIYIMIGVAGLGLFDTWFNFRKMIRNSEGEKT